jgi:transcriptional regulator
MYTPASSKIDDEAAIEAFVRRYDFATIVTPGSALVATHVPVVVRRAATGLVIVGHVARANDEWRKMNGASEALAIFLGPHGYVSPTWFASSPAVPTWNYAAVHAYGKPRAVEDSAFTKGLLDELVARYETAPDGWRPSSVPSLYYERLLGAIVAFEMPVDRLEAKFKLGQNRSPEDRAGTVAGLERAASPEAALLAAFMRSHGAG